jgi:hypothetical protein
MGLAAARGLVEEGAIVLNFGDFSGRQSVRLLPISHSRIYPDTFQRRLRFSIATTGAMADRGPPKATFCTRGQWPGVVRVGDQDPDVNQRQPGFGSLLELGDEFG